MRWGMPVSECDPSSSCWILPEALGLPAKAATSSQLMRKLEMRGTRPPRDRDQCLICCCAIELLARHTFGGELLSVLHYISLYFITSYYCILRFRSIGLEDCNLSSQHTILEQKWGRVPRMMSGNSWIWRPTLFDHLEPVIARVPNGGSVNSTLPLVCFFSHLLSFCVLCSPVHTVKEVASVKPCSPGFCPSRCGFCFRIACVTPLCFFSIGTSSPSDFVRRSNVWPSSWKGMGHGVPHRWPSASDSWPKGSGRLAEGRTKVAHGLCLLTINK